MQGLSSDLLVDRRLQGLDERRLEWQSPGGSNTLRPGPPISKLFQLVTTQVAGSRKPAPATQEACESGHLPAASLRAGRWLAWP
jgi:hypothetical protein